MPGFLPLGLRLVPSRQIVCQGTCLFRAPNGRLSSARQMLKLMGMSPAVHSLELKFTFSLYTASCARLHLHTESAGTLPASHTNRVS